MTARLHYWYLTQPRLGRPALLLAVLNALSITAVCAAPQASASTNAHVLNWTGLKDTYGVPIGNYYLAIASVREQITQAGPGVDWNPLTWMQWTLHALESMAFNMTAANILTTEAGLFIGIISLALWLMKITVSNYWLSVIGEIARAVASAVIQVTTQLGLLAVAVPIGVFAGVVTIKRGEVGRGWTMIGIAVTMPALSIAVFANPAGLMYGPDGLLAFARRVGFSVAQAATPGHNGAFAGVGSTGQVDALTASLITHTVREPLQLWNFGHVVDRVGACGEAWSAAVNRGQPDGPIRAMQACGNQAAVAYATHLDGNNIWVGAVFVVAALLLGSFMVISGWAVLKVSVKAIWTTVIVLPSLWVGSIPGAPQRRAMDVVWQFFRHGIEVLVFIVYVSVIGLAVEAMVSRPLPAELGGTNPFAHVLMMGAVSVAALFLLRCVRADLSGRPPGPGLFRQAGYVALGMGMHAAVGGAGGAAVAGTRGLGRRLRHRNEATPWEQIDAAASNAREVHGEPQPGFEPVPDSGDDPDSSGAGDAGGPSGGGPAPGGGAGGGAAVGAGGGELTASAPAGVSPILDQFMGGRAEQPAPRPRRSSRRQAGPAPQEGLDGDLADQRAAPPDHGRSAHAADAPAVPPVTFVADSRYTGAVPLPDPPPPDDELPPPDDDGRGPAGPTTVNPITDN